MAGNKEGALKAAKTNKERHGEDFYKRIGAKSWDNPRSHNTGFAKMSPEKRREYGKKGGQKTKEEYHKAETHTTTKVQEVRTGVSE